MKEANLDNPGQPKKEDRLASLEEKIDQVLKYQKSAHGWIVLRGIIGLIFFLIFIVLPILGGFYLFQYFKTNVDLEKIGSQYTEFLETIEELRSNAGGLGNLMK